MLLPSISVINDYALHVLYDDFVGGVQLSVELCGYKEERYVAMLDAVLWCIIISIGIQWPGGSSRRLMVATLNMLVHMEEGDGGACSHRGGVVVDGYEWIFRDSKNGDKFLKDRKYGWLVIKNLIHMLASEFESFLEAIARKIHAPLETLEVVDRTQDMLDNALAGKISIIQTIGLSLIIPYIIYVCSLALTVVYPRLVTGIATVISYGGTIGIMSLVSKSAITLLERYRMWGALSVLSDYLMDLSKFVVLATVLSLVFVPPSRGVEAAITFGSLLLDVCMYIMDQPALEVGG